MRHFRRSDKLQKETSGSLIVGETAAAGDCPGGYDKISSDACFSNSECPDDRYFCAFTKNRNHGICCPKCTYKSISSHVINYKMTFLIITHITNYALIYSKYMLTLFFFFIMLDWSS